MSICSFAQTAINEILVENNFVSGEQLKFNLNYGWFNIGSASLHISDTVYENCDAYQLGGFWSNSWFSESVHEGRRYLGSFYRKVRSIALIILL